VANGDIVFFGTPQICLPFLDALRCRWTIGLIITQPDAGSGRQRRMQSPPVKEYAQGHGIDLWQAETLSAPQEAAEAAKRIEALKPLLAVVIAYGKMIPRRLFTMPRFGTVNLHFSLLPKYRGAAPVQRAIAAGETRTGMTVFEISQSLDAGDIWCQQEMEILPEETAEALVRRMTETGPQFLVSTVAGIVAARLSKRPQDHALATFAPALRKEEGRIDWQLSANELANRFRAFFPWPGLYFPLGDQRIKVMRARAAPVAAQPTKPTSSAQPGKILAIDRDGMRICCGSGTVLAVEEIQPAGKRPMAPCDFCRGNPLPERLI